MSSSISPSGGGTAGPRLRLLLLLLRRTDADAVDDLALQFRRGRIELDAMTGPVVGIVTGDGGDSIPVGHVERERLHAAAEIQDGFFFCIAAAAERLGRSVA